ncbi:hypothetical protein BCF11_3318 [Collimonas sp. PA-H2]|uniref:beta strand repeat-containing protein n=1 Tax=Collimonas sp. PA-H2 TaxID=1881062 RepID=UPI000BF393E3|nr:hypothetical protein [Collimonas sp. PA-H2]PFH10884.1 hypothetical protein BCF11_3318 [Collimonas sp. PA-H2]
MTTVAGTLTSTQTQQAQQQANTIAGSASKIVSGNQFVFFAAFDGTNNDKNNVPSGAQSTNVAQLSDQATSAALTNPNLKVGYYAGPGTAGSLTGSSAVSTQVTQEAINTANKAYKEFSVAASAWLGNNPGGSVTTAMTAFSRGADAAAVFSQLLYERGLTDPSTGAILIPPGKVGVSAGVIYDPVETGMSGNMVFAPNAQNLAIIRADNEYRYLFKAADYSAQPGATTFIFTGNHCDIGGTYDNGLAGLTLQAGTGFLQNSGLSISNVPVSRQFNTSVPPDVHTEAIDPSNNQVWSTYGTYGVYTGQRLTNPVETLPTVSSTVDTTTTAFTDYTGNDISYAQTKNAAGIQNSMTIKDYFNGTTTTKIDRDTNSDGKLDQLENIKVDTPGNKSDDLTNLKSDGTAQNEQVTNTSATGQVTATISGTGAAAYLNNAIISLAAGAQATINGNGDVTSEIANSGAFLSVFGQNQTVNGNTGSNLVNLGGASTSATVNGGGSVGICGTNQTLTATGSTVNFSAGGFATSVKGTNDIINEWANSGAYIGVWGQNQTIYGVSGSSRIDLNNVGTSATVYGSGSSVGICANNQILTANGETVNFAAGGFATSVKGSSDIINEWANSGAYIGVWGQNQTIYGVSGSSRIDLNDVGTSATVYGSGSSVGICATNQILTTTGETVNFSAGGFSTSIKGASDIINEAANSGAYLVVQGQNQTVNGDSGSSHVDLAGNGTTATVNGSGSSVGIFGNNTTLTTSNETVNFGVGGLTTILYGNGDTTNFWGNSGAYLQVSGQNHIINGDTGSSHVDLFGAGTSATVNGSGSSVGIFGNSTTLTTSNETVNFGVGGLTTYLYGNGDTTNFWGNSGAYLVLQGQNQTVNGDTGSSHVDLTGVGTSATVNGSGSSVGIFGNNTTLTTSNETVNFGVGGLTTSLYGNGDTTNIWANSGAYLAVGGQNQIINGISGSSRVDLSGAGTSALVNGSGSSVGFCATNQTLTTTGSQTINYAANNFVTSLNGAYDTVNGGIGEQLSLNGGHNTLNFGTSSSLAVNGDNETIGMGTGSSLFADGASDTINASGSAIVLGKALQGKVVYINGNNNIINAVGSNGVNSEFFVTGTGNYIETNGSTVHCLGGNQSSQYSNTVVGAFNTTNGKTTGSAPNLGGTVPLLPGSVDPTGSGVTTYSVPTPVVTVTPIDPIILNLDGHKVQTTDLVTSTAYFDMQNNGKKVHTGWATAGEGMLVYDPTNTGTVTSDANLVGGFGALSALAHQTGGVLDASNSLWDKLKVWVDPTGNANFQQGKLESLKQLGIASINLDSTAEKINSNGNTILNDTTFSWKNGKTGDIAGVSLTFDPSTVASTNTKTGDAASSAPQALSGSLNHLIQTMSAFTDGNTGIDANASFAHLHHEVFQVVAPQFSRHV